MTVGQYPQFFGAYLLLIHIHRSVNMLCLKTKVLIIIPVSYILYFNFIISILLEIGVISRKRLSAC